MLKNYPLSVNVTGRGFFMFSTLTEGVFILTMVQFHKKTKKKLILPCIVSGIYISRHDIFL